MKFKKDWPGHSGQSQLVEKPLLKATGLHFAGGVRGGGSPFVWNQMPAKSLRQQAFAPRSG
ncbi:hypothetical protein, partial [Dysosmobacter sp.]|uniref:hypothetical protein n=1 Tax=Dysosmobacter sp. TaxID=2591382 RepID=UPI002A892174